MLLLPQRNVPSSGGQMALQPLDQAHSWPTEPDLPPQPAPSRGEGMDSWQLAAQPVAFVSQTYQGRGQGS